MSCHGGNRHLAFWASGRHVKNDVSCNNCHTLHTVPGPGATIALTKKNPTISPYETTSRQLQYETCTSCHKQIRAQLLNPRIIRSSKVVSRARIVTTPMGRSAMRWSRANR